MNSLNLIRNEDNCFDIERTDNLKLFTFSFKQIDEKDRWYNLLKTQADQVIKTKLEFDQKKSGTLKSLKSGTLLGRMHSMAFRKTTSHQSPLSEILPTQKEEKQTKGRLETLLSLRNENFQLQNTLNDLLSKKTYLETELTNQNYILKIKNYENLIEDYKTSFDAMNLRNKKILGKDKNQINMNSLKPLLGRLIDSVE